MRFILELPSLPDRRLSSSSSKRQETELMETTLALTG
jgi:hypothetical protein